MMSAKDVSLTPPHTPTILDSGDEDSLDYMDYFNKKLLPASLELKDDDSKEKVKEGITITNLIFDCAGENHYIDRRLLGNYIASLALYNLLELQNPLYKIASAALDLSPSSSHIPISHLFNKIRKNIQIVEKGLRVQSFGIPNLAMDHRKEVTDILKGISLLITEEPGSDDIPSIASEINNLLLFLGPLFDLPQFVTNAHSPLGNNCSSPAFHLFHLHLDLRWWCLAILYQIDVKFVAKDRLKFKPFIKELYSSDQEGKPGYNVDCCFSFVFWDLVTLTERQVTKASISELRSVPGFPCTCSYELALSLLHMLEYRSKLLNTQRNFWNFLKEKILLAIKVTNDGSSFQNLKSQIVTFPNFSQMQLHHIWWIFVNFAQLFLHDIEGNPVDRKSISIVPEPKLLRTLIRFTFVPEKSLSEEQARFFMNCCHLLLEMWPSSGICRHSDWLILLWEYLSKCLDSSFLLQEGFSAVCMSPSSLVSLVKSLVSEASMIGKRDNSWHIFLKILVVVVKESDEEWRALKGRIYSKFFPKKMLELSSTGLYNTSLLFLVLASSSSREEFTVLCVKLCDLLISVPLENLTKANRVSLVLGSVAYLMTMEGIALYPVSDKLSSWVSQLISHMSGPNRSEVGQCFTTYCEGIRDSLRIATSLTLDQEKLFCIPMGSILTHGSVAEQKALLFCIEEALSKVASDPSHLTSGSSVCMIESILTTFEQPLKTYCLSLNPQILVASVLAHLVTCCTRFSTEVLSNTRLTEYSNNWLCFILGNDAVSNRVSLIFIMKLLEARDVTLRLSHTHPNFEEKLVSLLLSSLIVSGTTDEVLAAKDKIFNIPEIVQVVPLPPTCPFGSYQKLLQTLAQNFSTTEVFQERMNVRTKAFGYFESLEKSILSLLRQTKAPIHLPDVMRLIGCIFKHCHNLFYIKGKSTCPLVGILSATVLPRTIYNLDKPLSPAMSEALRSILPQVICGLNALNSALDPFVSRCLKDIFVNYVPRYPPLSHPFLTVFKESSDNLKTLQSIFIESMKESFLSGSKCSPSHRILVLSLLLELGKLDPFFWMKPFSIDVFPKLLDLLFQFEGHEIQRSITDLLREILNETKNSPSNVRIALGESVRVFVVSQLAWASARVFRTLDRLATLNKALILEALPGIAEAIRDTEERRGSGLDQSLRKGYASILSKLSVEKEEL